MQCRFKEKFNIITGDNGLGKSFLLDVIWWTLTRVWPQELNNRVLAGRKAIPTPNKSGRIEAYISSRPGKLAFSDEGEPQYDPDSNDVRLFEAEYQRSLGRWRLPKGRKIKGGLTLYAMVDGSFAVWDPERNYWKEDNAHSPIDNQPAFVFSQAEVWDGQKIDGIPTCNGLIADYSNTSFKDDGSLELLSRVLKNLSPDPQKECFDFGPPTRVSVNDARDIPTIRMPYSKGKEATPIIHVSSAIKRVLSLAYLLVWAWREHQLARKLRGSKSPKVPITLLIDEIDAHLHPRWQRTLLDALIRQVKELTGSPSVQVITTTHSPLIMASCEDFFDRETDQWLDLDYDRASGGVILTARDFERKGKSDSWLQSEAFDLPSTRSVNTSELIARATRLVADPKATKAELEGIYEELVKHLSPKDHFLFAWKYHYQQRISGSVPNLLNH